MAEVTRKKKELPRYRINCQFPGAQIPGVAGLVLPGTEVVLGNTIGPDRKPVEIEPRNSWLPLNDAAKAAFERRNKRLIALAKSEGINGSGPMEGAELDAFIRKLQPDADRTPHLTSVDDEPEDQVIAQEAPEPEPARAPEKVPNPIQELVPPKAAPRPAPRASDS